MTKSLGLKPPHEERLCLSCHTLHVASKPPLPRTILSDGVGCEACHGPAKSWLVSHTLKDHNSQQLGMTNTGDVHTRAKLCVDCHVGTPPQGTSAARDVNHDLIAAGHPRLAFELTSYLEAMPPHWTTPLEEDPIDVWATGRLVSLEAALDLLKYRAETSNTTASASAVRSPWPEFAEFDCFNCHRPMEVTDKPDSAWPLGLPKQNPWQVAVVDKLFAPADAKQKPAFIWMDAADPWKPIEPAAVQSAEADLKTAWGELATWHSNKPATPDLLQRFDADGMIDDTNWDEAAQLSLALAALAARERQALPKAKRDELDEKLAALREAVQFPQHMDRTGSSYHFDSPRNYSPDKFREAKQALVAILRGINSPPGK